mmetsp:Transcript_65917/g.137634  ORF Transcript_65917/g.137634 Transcript_65917/m.137634 type:complete len:273 (-) Transcript_65917:1371-2189(-)
MKRVMDLQQESSTQSFQTHHVRDAERHFRRVGPKHCLNTFESIKSVRVEDAVQHVQAAVVVESEHTLANGLVFLVAPAWHRQLDGSGVGARGEFGKLPQVLGIVVGGVVLAWALGIFVVGVGGGGGLFCVLLLQALDFHRAPREAGAHRVVEAIQLPALVWKAQIELIFVCSERNAIVMNADHPDLGGPDLMQRALLAPRTVLILVNRKAVGITDDMSHCFLSVAGDDDVGPRQRQHLAAAPMSVVGALEAVLQGCIPSIAPALALLRRCLH